MIPVSTLCNSDHPKLSLYAAAEKKHLKIILIYLIWFVIGILLAHGHNNLVWSLSIFGNDLLTK